MIQMRSTCCSQVHHQLLPPHGWVGSVSLLLSSLPSSVTSLKDHAAHYKTAAAAAASQAPTISLTTQLVRYRMEQPELTAQEPVDQPPAVPVLPKNSNSKCRMIISMP